MSRILVITGAFFDGLREYQEQLGMQNTSAPCGELRLVGGRSIGPYSHYNFVKPEKDLLI
jgi:hypothetical protein